MLSRATVATERDEIRPFTWRTIASAEETFTPGLTGAHSKGPVQNDEVFQRRIAQSESVAEERILQSREDGLREGEALGRARAEEQVRAAVDRLAASIARIDDYRTSLYRQVEMDAVKLAFAIARRVLRRELTVDPSAIEGLASAALDRLQSQESCRVRMHPNHVPALRAAIERLGMTSKVEVVADATQEIGAAVFELTRGSLDASVDAQLREIERGLADRFERS
jgi:flagellar assembly protein FliH